MVRKTGVQPQVESYQRLKNMVLAAALQHYKMRIMGKVDQSRDWSGALPCISM